MVKITIRADASVQIGVGHVMRCLTLADTLKAAGAVCNFICQSYPGNLIEHIRERGHAVISLPTGSNEVVANDEPGMASTKYANWLGASWAIDAEQTKLCIGATTIDWMIVDRYALDARWEQAVRSTCRKLMVIDDLADRPHDCDLLLDQNLGRGLRHYSRLVPKGCTVLTGPHYALLRSEFAALRDYSLRRRTNPQLKNILIAMGGVDQANATGRVLETLRYAALPKEARITAVMGLHSPWIDRVRLLAAQMPRVAEVKVNVRNMAQLMADSDLAIGAAGSSSWERCCLGLPSLTISLAPNQDFIGETVGGAGAARHLGRLAEVTITLVEEALRELIDAPMTLARMSALGIDLVDGCGAARVAEAMG